MGADALHTLNIGARTSFVQNSVASLIPLLREQIFVIILFIPILFVSLHTHFLANDDPSDKC